MNKLMTHLYYGDVSPEFSENLAITLANNGADILEIGIPYSDPVSDGAVFQRACREALVNGITPIKVLDGIKNIRKKTVKPIYLTSYFGPIFKTGIEKIFRMAKNAGVNGLIIPDLPYEEQEKYLTIFKKFNLPIIQFATVYSSEERLREIIKKSQDFVYCVSLSGVTGDRVNEKGLRELIKKLKKLTDEKIFCGFGIKNSTDAKKITTMGAEGIIVGSAIAELYQNAKDKNESLNKIGNLITNIKNAIN